MGKKKQGIPVHWKERLAELKRTMLWHLSQEGIQDADVLGMELHYEGIEGEDFSAFWYAVTLKEQQKRFYRVDETGIFVDGVKLGKA